MIFYFFVTHLAIRLLFLQKEESLSSYKKKRDYIYIRGSLNKFPDFFRIGTFIDSTRMKL